MVVTTVPSSMEDETFVPAQEWMRSVLPEGIPVGESTLISGPGGSGKPLVGLAVVDSWLRAGGSAVVLLTNSDAEFVTETMATLYDADLDDHGERLAWIDFDPTLEPHVKAMAETADAVRGNLVDPAVWQRALDAALSRTPETDPGTLVFGPALNLFLFSPTYGDAMVDTLVETVSAPDDATYLFSVSTSAFRDRIASVESAADTLLMTRREEGTLYLRGERAASVDIVTEEVAVPFTSDEIGQVKSVAEETRDSIIPTIKGL